MWRVVDSVTLYFHFQFFFKWYPRYYWTLNNITILQVYIKTISPQLLTEKQFVHVQCNVCGGQRKLDSLEFHVKSDQVFVSFLIKKKVVDWSQSWSYYIFFSYSQQFPQKDQKPITYESIYQYFLTSFPWLWLAQRVNVRAHGDECVAVYLIFLQEQQKNKICTHNISVNDWFLVNLVEKKKYISILKLIWNTVYSPF